MASLRMAAAPKSDQLNACDFFAGPKTYKIASVIVGTGEQPVSVYFDGVKLPWKPCKSMMRVMMAIWQTEDGDDFVGKSVTIYNDESVTWAGVAVGGIRISHASHIKSPRKLVLRTTKKTTAEVTILPLVFEVAKITDDQLKQITDLLAEHDDIKTAVLAGYKIVSLADFDATKFEKAIEAINKRIGDKSAGLTTKGA